MKIAVENISLPPSCASLVSEIGGKSLRFVINYSFGSFTSELRDKGGTGLKSLPAITSGAGVLHCGVVRFRFD